MTINRSLLKLWNEYNDFFENELHLEHWDQQQRKEALFDCIIKWHYKIIQQGHKNIGFVFWGDPAYQLKHEFGYEIAIHDAYIKSEYRNKGIMTEQIYYIVNHPMFIKRRVCLFVLDNNQTAFNIWKATLKKLNFIFDGEIDRNDNGKWYGFSRE